MHAHILIGRYVPEQQVSKAFAKALGRTLRLAGFKVSTMECLGEALNWQGSGDVIIETDNSVMFYARPRG